MNNTRPKESQKEKRTIENALFINHTMQCIVLSNIEPQNPVDM